MSAIVCYDNSTLPVSAGVGRPSIPSTTPAPDPAATQSNKQWTVATLPAGNDRSHGSASSHSASSARTSLGSIRDGDAPCTSPSTSTANQRTDTPSTQSPRLKRKRVTECSTCSNETSPTTRFPSRKITMTCKHPGETCKSCLKSWIISQLDTVAWDHISCSECDQIMQYEDVKFHSSPATFRRYDNAALHSYLSTDPSFQPCPSLGCDSGQLHPNGVAEPIFTCITCQARSCLSCHAPWHEGRTCGQVQQEIADGKQADADAQRRMAEEEMSESVIKGIAKICPNVSCGVRIQKNSDCDHMTCRQCGREFCWRCSADYKDIRRIGNTAHAVGCRHHM